MLPAAAPTPPLPSPALAVRAAAADIVRLPPQHRYTARYLWLPQPEGRKREETALVLLLHLNLLSREGAFHHPVRVAPDLLRVDLYKLKIDPAVWENTRKTDVFFHQKVRFLKDARVTEYWPGGKDKGGTFYARGRYSQNHRAGALIDAPGFWLPAEAIDLLRAETCSESPVLSGPWFFVQSARQVSLRNEQEGTGYYDFLGLKDRDAFFRTVGLNEKEAKRLFQEWRAAVKVSGISQQNRQVFAFRATTGRAWGTLDTFKEKGPGVVRRNLRAGEFAHDAEEWYGYLPNGLPVTFLSNAQGAAQESAPDKIGGDTSPLNVGKDNRVHANLSCVRCHGARSRDERWLKPVDDWARTHFRQRPMAAPQFRLQDPDKRVELGLRRQYLSELNRQLVRDREDYADAVARLTATRENPRGLTIHAVSTLYCKAWNDYAEQGVTLEDAARELGATPERFRASLAGLAKLKGGLDLVLSSYIDTPPDALTRLEWEDSYAAAQAALHGVVHAEVAEKRKVKK